MPFLHVGASTAWHPRVHVSADYDYSKVSGWDLRDKLIAASQLADLSTLNVLRSVKNGVYYYSPNHTTHKARLRTTMRVTDSTRLKLTAEYKDVKRETSVLREQKTRLGAELRQRLPGSVTGSLGYAFTVRHAKDWDKTVSSYAFSNLASYREHEAKLGVDFPVADKVFFTPYAKLYTRQYTRDGEDALYHNGVGTSNGQNAGFDLSFSPVAGLNFSTFYAFDREFIRWGLTKGKAFSTLGTTNRIHTIGFSTRLSPKAAAWEAGLSYVYTDAKTNNTDALYNGVLFGDSSVRSHGVQANGVYRLNRQLSLHAQAGYASARAKGSQDKSTTATAYRAGPNYDDTFAYFGVKYALE